jgi:hypothetical protein
MLLRRTVAKPAEGLHSSVVDPKLFIPNLDLTSETFRIRIPIRIWILDCASYWASKSEAQIEQIQENNPGQKISRYCPFKARSAPLYSFFFFFRDRYMPAALGVFLFCISFLFSTREYSMYTVYFQAAGFLILYRCIYTVPVHITQLHWLFRRLLKLFTSNNFSCYPVCATV